MNSLLVNIYRDSLLQIKRGTHNGHPINAKPLYVLSIISMIDDVMLTENEIYYNTTLKDYYDKVCGKYILEKPTPLFKPYLFLSSDQFYHINWKQQMKLPHDSSEKFIRENVNFAYIDNAFWDLLQESEIRDYYQQTIVTYFLK